MHNGLKNFKKKYRSVPVTRGHVVATPLSILLLLSTLPVRHLRAYTPYGFERNGLAKLWVRS